MARGRTGVGPGIRLTRRGRVVLIIAVAAVSLVAIWLSTRQMGTAAISPARAQRALPAVTVQQGDTVWSIAVRVRPDADPRETVRRIETINGLTDPIIQPGQRLYVPTG